MINSMTGYGKGIYEQDGQKLVVELKSVNHRFLDLNVKVPKGWTFAEDLIRKAIKDKLSRGHIDAFVFYEDNRLDKIKISVDYELARAYCESAVLLNKELGVANNLGAFELLRMPDVAVARLCDANDDILATLATQATLMAIDNLSKMRATEGELMVADIQSKLVEIGGLVEQIEGFAPLMVADHRKKIEDRIKELLGAVEVDEARLLNEVAFYTDKVCIDEEISRMKSHLVHIQEIICKGGVIGKQLDFIIQEMNRESNTMGSKCCDIRVSNCVLSLKSNIEKIREQVQNIE